MKQVKVSYRRSHVLSTLLVLTIASSLTDCFVPASRKIPSIAIHQAEPKGEQVDESEQENDKYTTPVSDAANGVKTPGTRRRRRRQVDYPSFAFDIARKKREREPVLMKFKNSQGKEVVFRTTRPKSVSIPKKEATSSWWLGSMSTPLETGLSIISETASKTRLRVERSYARKEPFEFENIAVPPSLSDLSTPRCKPFEGFWISWPARLLSYVVAYVSFPFITRFVDSFVTMPSEQLDEITQKFSPGISILYGTFISLTLSILYNRQRTIQDNVGIECSYLVVLTRNLISLFRNNRKRAIEAAQCAADQIRTLVRSSRGAELMLLMYSDPYARARELVDLHEEELYRERSYDGRSNSLIGNCRDTIKDLYKVRANRLSDEALALPPTHFLILNILTLLILLGYTASIIPTLDKFGNPSNESCLLFSVLSTIYVLFYNFASDLNAPFQGVYQIRRSAAASHLLQLKWLIANHPLLRGEIDFEDPEEDASGVQIECPGLGDLLFEKEELFVEIDDIEKQGPEPSTDLDLL